VKINRYELAGLPAGERAQLTRRAQADLSAVMPVADAIVADVRERGDEAVAEYTRRFDGASLRSDQLRVTAEEFDEAETLVKPELRSALELAIGNVRRHHERNVQVESWMHETVPGVIVGERSTPIASAGLYVPRGKGSFPSVMMMLCVPAVIAQVPQIVVCTPPNPDGKVDPASLVVAKTCGVTTVFKVGGAQAVAALAYGTETIPKVEKIAGPGNQYVAAARRLVYGHVDPGMPAGPSESIVLCDAAASAEVAARELLIECEHGPDSSVFLVTDSAELADAVVGELTPLLEKLPERRRAFCESVLSGFGGIVVSQSFDDSVAFVNEYAPEHLRVLTGSPFEVLPRILHAGEILLGERSSIAYGNFVVGVNAILPTGGAARAYSGIGVEDFTKRSSFAYVSAEGAARVGQAAVEIAEYEGFPAHANAADFARR